MDICIIISSCDLYSDCWKPMFLSLKENWKNSSIPVYLICNYKDCGDENVTSIKVGEHLGWGSNTKKALGQLDSEYVLLLQEDYFLNSSMNDEVVLKHLSFCKENGLDYLRLGMPFNDDLLTVNPNYCECPLDREYSLCLQPAIWKRETLQRLTIEGWTGWDFERDIVAYINTNGIQIKAAVIHSSVLKEQGYNMVHGTAIRKGIWTEGGIDFLKKHGFTEQIKGRKREGRLFTWLTDVPENSLFIYPAKVLRKIIQTIKIKL